jgi:Flp pilus assembly pilin Flp
MLKIIDAVRRLTARARRASQDGQAMVEYSLILALGGLALLGTLTLVNGGIENLFQAIVDVL